MRRHSWKPKKALQACALAFALCLTPGGAADGRAPGLGACTLMDAFLDRLMLAESGGDVLAKNPRSSALGPYQFIRSTFLEVSRRHFSDEIGELSKVEVLRLRTDLAFSRRVARAYSRQNATFLRRRGIVASLTNLRLAFFAGATGAARVLTAKPETPVSNLLTGEALRANPFLYGMTASALMRRSAREAGGLGLLELHPDEGKTRGTGVATIKLRCSLRRPSCRKWLFLRKKRLARTLARRGLKDVRITVVR
ncbi:MAG: hypothetical protein ACR2PO_18085 [Methyloligellaceae bacterium]